MDTVIAKEVKAKVANLKKLTPHAVLIIGRYKADNIKLAKLLAEELLEVDELSSYPYHLNVALEKDKKNISIEQIRSLQNFLSLKVAGTKVTDRAVIIQDGETMSIEAQNALLKILEEPPKGSLVILLTDNESLLLPTVISRCVKIYNVLPSKSELKDTFKGYSEDEFNKAYAISSSDETLLNDILNTPEHPLLTAAAEARSLLQNPIYERLLKVDQLSKDKQLSLNIIYILQRMAQISLEASAKDSDKWQNVLNCCYIASDALSKNGQTKLTLINLFINI